MGLLKNIKEKVKDISKDVSETVHKVKDDAVHKIKDMKSGHKEKEDNEKETEREVVKIPHENHKYEPDEKQPDKFPGTYDVERKNIAKEVFEKTGSMQHEGVGQSSTIFKEQKNPVKIAHGIKQEIPAKIEPEINQASTVKVSHGTENRKHVIKRTGGVRRKRRVSNKKP